MNYKLLLPTYRTRYRYVTRELEALRAAAPIERALNLGTGEGDYDAMIASYCEQLHACDINPEDIAYATGLNQNVPNLHYSVENGEALSYDDASFDLVICLEVIEHVGDPRALLSEIARVTRPGARIILTCPSHFFPATYDPINSIARRLGKTFPLGAYGYGHSWLCKDDEIATWCEDAGLEVERVDHLSKHLVGGIECYTPGILQAFLKRNAGNTQSSKDPRVSLRPSQEVPRWVGITDAVIALDRALFSGSRRSVGLGFLLTRS